jgi:GNAT superfamily N-acetyltransferase
MLFLIHYDRAKGRLVSIREFPETKMSDASAAKIDLEISLLGGSNRQEVVLLEADSRDDLRKTHRRYFETFEELRGDSGRGSSEKAQVREDFAINIRPAYVTDVPAVRWLQGKVLPPRHPYDYSLNIGSPSCVNLVACWDKEVVGYISVLTTVNNPAGAALWHRLAPYIGFIGVLPEYQKKGVCRSLIQEVVSLLRSANDSGVVYLECPIEISHIYERLGFKKLDKDLVARRWGVVPKSVVMQLG